MTMTDTLTHEQIYEMAEALGAEHGKAAGSWVIDGNTSAEAAQALLTGIEDGDPAVMDTMPSPLGSYEHGMASLVEEADIDYGSLNTDEIHDVNDLDPFCNGYEAGFTSAYWAEVETSATAAVA